MDTIRSLPLMIFIFLLGSTLSCLTGRRKNEVYPTRTTDSYQIPNKFRTTTSILTSQSVTSKTVSSTLAPTLQPTIQTEATTPQPGTTQSSTSTTTTTTTQASQSQWPTTLGVNLDAGWTHPHGYFRQGQATDTHSCDYVREIPSDLRESAVMYKHGIHISYTKYTEAYGIPIIGTLNVTDVGLSRACYVVRMMLASRYDIRNAIYKFYVRIALIGDVEEQTDLWDYRHLDPDYWDSRARGVGATMTIPVCSAGDDNMRCLMGSRYDTEDILIHEFAHGVHQLGAYYVIPTFQARLNQAYQNAMDQGKYANKYMARNANEYFAQGAQMYFDSFNAGTYKVDINGTDVILDSAETLRLFDPDLVDLLDETFSCNNKMINRCAYQVSCGIQFYEEVKERNHKFTSRCTTGGLYRSTRTVEQCAVYACKENATAFLQVGSTCRTLKCATSNIDDLMLEEVQGSFGYNIWRQIHPLEIALLAESSHEINQLCTKPPDHPGRCNILVAERRQCGPPSQSETQCVAKGCCFIDNECLYSALARCVDNDKRCVKYAVSGECERNPGLMHRICQLSCNLCTNPSPYTEVILASMCQDTNIACVDTMTDIKCSYSRNQEKCPLTCGVCSLASDNETHTYSTTEHFQ